MLQLMDHARIQEFSSGGVQVSLTKISSDNVFFFFFFFFFNSSAYFTEVNWSNSKKSIIFEASRGSPTFCRGVQLFPGGRGGGGVQLLIPYRNPYNL